MKKQILTLAFIALGVNVATAQWWSNEKIKGNGDYINETRTTNDYDQVALEGSMDVELISGNEGELSIQAESNLMEYILTEVSGDRLKIYIEKGVQLDASRNMEIKIKVPIEDLEAVSLTGSGDIISSNKIAANDFKVSLTGSGDIELELESQKVQGRITGSGDIILSGTTEEFDCGVTGSGDFNAARLKANKVSATVSGSGDIEVYAVGHLKSRVSGSGDITYKGNPKHQDFKTFGSGSISSR